MAGKQIQPPLTASRKERGHARSRAKSIVLILAAAYGQSVPRCEQPTGITKPTDQGCGAQASYLNLPCSGVGLQRQHATGQLVQSPCHVLADIVLSQQYPGYQTCLRFPHHDPKGGVWTRFHQPLSPFRVDRSDSCRSSTQRAAQSHAASSSG